MSYTLVLVGGTGQRFGLGLGYLNLLGIATMPDRVVVIDAEGVNASNPVAEALPRLLQFGQPTMQFKWIEPYPSVGGKDFTVTDCVDVKGSELFPLGYSDDDARVKLAAGFFAVPKLAALVFRSLVNGNGNLFHDEVDGGEAQGSVQRRVFIVGSVAGGTGAGILREVAHLYKKSENRVFGIVFTRFFDIGQGEPSTTDIDRNARLGCEFLLRRDQKSPFDVLTVIGPPHGTPIGPPVESSEGRPHDFAGLAAALALVTDGGAALSARYDSERTNAKRAEGEPFRLDLGFAARRDQEPLHDVDIRFPTRDARGGVGQITLADAADAAAAIRRQLEAWRRFRFTDAAAVSSLFVERKLGREAVRTLRARATGGRSFRREAAQLWEKLKGAHGAIVDATAGLAGFEAWVAGIVQARSLRRRRESSTELIPTGWRDALALEGGIEPGVALDVLAQRWCVRVARAQWQARVHAPEGGGGRPLYPHVKTGLASAPGELVPLQAGEIAVADVDSRSFATPFGQAHAFAKSLDAKDAAATRDAETLWLALSIGWLEVDVKDLARADARFERLAAIDPHMRFIGLLRVRQAHDMPEELTAVAGRVVGATHPSCGLWPGLRADAREGMERLTETLARGTRRDLARAVLRRWTASFLDGPEPTGAWWKVVADLAGGANVAQAPWSDVRTRGPVMLETAPGNAQPFYLFAHEPGRAADCDIIVRALAGTGSVDGDQIVFENRSLARVRRRRVTDEQRQFDPAATLGAGYLDLDCASFDRHALARIPAVQIGAAEALAAKVGVPEELMRAWRTGNTFDPSPLRPDLLWTRTIPTDGPVVTGITEVSEVDGATRVVLLHEVAPGVPKVPGIAFHPGRRRWVVWLHDVVSNPHGVCHRADGAVIRVQVHGGSRLLRFPADSIILEPHRIFATEGFRFATRSGSVLPALPIKAEYLDLVECDDRLRPAESSVDALAFKFRLFGGLEVMWRLPVKQIVEESGVHVELWPQVRHPAWQRFWIAIEADTMPDYELAIYARSKHGTYELQRRVGGVDDPHAGSRYLSVKGSPRLLWMGRGGKGAGFILFPDEGPEQGPGLDATIAVDFGTFRTGMLVAVPSMQPDMAWPSSAARLPGRRFKVVDNEERATKARKLSSLFPPTEGRAADSAGFAGTVATVLRSAIAYPDQSLPGAQSIPFQDFGVPVTSNALSIYPGDEAVKEHAKDGLKWRDDLTAVNARLAYLKAILLLGAVEAFGRGATRLSICYSFPLAYDNPQQLDVAFRAAADWLEKDVLAVRDGVSVHVQRPDSESNAGMTAAEAKDDWIVTLDLGGGTLDLGLFQGKAQPEPRAWDSVKLGGNLVLAAAEDPRSIRWKIISNQLDFYREKSLGDPTARLLGLAIEYAARVVAGTMLQQQPRPQGASLTMLLLGSGWRWACCLTQTSKFHGVAFEQQYGVLLQQRLATLAPGLVGRVAVNARLLDEEREKLAVAFGLARNSSARRDPRDNVNAPNGLDESEKVRWTTMVEPSQGLGFALDVLASPAFPTRLEEMAPFGTAMKHTAKHQEIQTRLHNATIAQTSIRKRTALGIAYECLVPTWFQPR